MMSMISEYFNPLLEGKIKTEGTGIISSFASPGLKHIYLNFTLIRFAVFNFIIPKIGNIAPQWQS